MSSHPISVGALIISFLVEEESVSLFEVDVPAQARVPAPHSHDAFDEVLYGLAGVTTWTLDGEARELSAGEALHVPAGAVHHFANAGEQDARFLAMVAPGAIGPAYFREVGAAVAEGPQAVDAVMRRHGLTPVAAGAPA